MKLRKIAQSAEISRKSKFRIKNDFLKKQSLSKNIRKKIKDIFNVLYFGLYTTRYC